MIQALFLVDNVTAMKMMSPIMSKLPLDWEPTFLCFGASNQGYTRFQGTNCLELGGLNRKRVSVLLDRIKPSILIFAREETTFVEPMFLEATKERGVPTLLVPHGLIVSNSSAIWKNGNRLWHLWLLAKQGSNKLRREHTSIPQLLLLGLFRMRNDFNKKGRLSRFDRFSMIAAYGETMRDILIQQGIPERNITITGNPKMDEYNRDYSKVKPLVGRTDIRVLLLTNYFVEFGLWNTSQRSKFVRDVRDAVSAVSSIPLAIRIHPGNENRKDYIEIKRKYNCEFDLCGGTSLSDEVQGCDVAITTSSSSGLEVLVAGKPLIIYNPYDNVTAYSQDSGSYLTYDKTELLEALHSILDKGISQNRREMMNKFAYQQSFLPDKGAAKRIADLIVKMIKGEEQ